MVRERGSPLCKRGAFRRGTAINQTEIALISLQWQTEELALQYCRGTHTRTHSGRFLLCHLDSVCSENAAAIGDMAILS